MVIKYRAIIIVLCIFITIVMAFFLKDLKVNSDIVSYLPQKDSVVAQYVDIGHKFGIASMACVIIEARNEVFTVESIKHISDLTNSISSLPGVEDATSITNAIQIKQSGNGCTLGRVIDRGCLPKTCQECMKIKEEVLSDCRYKGRLVSADSRYAMIVCTYKNGYDRTIVSETIKELVASKKLPEKIYFGGSPFHFVSIVKYVREDLLFLIPIIILVIAMVLFIGFRTVRSALIPIIVVGMSVVWTLGLMSLLKVSLTPVSGAIPVVLFAVGSAYSIHIYNRYRMVIRTPEDKLRQCSDALCRVGYAVIFSGITTIIGFLSFTYTRSLNIISAFGLYSVIGIVVVLVISLTFVPAFLSYLPVENIKSKSFGKKHFEPLEQFLEKLSDQIIIHPGRIIIIWLIVTAVMVAGIPFIKSRLDIYGYFDQRTDIRVSASIIDKEFGGSLPVVIKVKGDIFNPAVLLKMKKVHDFLKEQPALKNISYIGSYLKDVNEALGYGRHIPADRDSITDLVGRIKNEAFFRHMVDGSMTESVITASSQNLDSKGCIELNNSLNSLLSKLNSREAGFSQTGMPAIYSKMYDLLSGNFLQSFIFSLVLIVLCMWILLRLVRSTLIGLIPLFLSMIITYGFMGYTGIAFDICTILIGGIIAGTGVDYTIHFLMEYKHHIKQGRSVEDAIEFAIRISGKSIVINVLLVMSGFLVLVFSNIVPLHYLGLLIAFATFFSGIGAITILPALISRFKLKMVRERDIRITRIDT